MRGALRAAALATALGLAACGVKRPPIAPGDLRPNSPRGLRVESVDGGLELAWRAPETYDEGFPITDEPGWDLAGFHVLRRAGDAGKAEIVGDVRALAPAPGAAEARYRWRDEALAPGTIYTYWVSAYGSDGFDGDPAGPARFAWEAPPGAPSLAAEAGDRYVVLTWTAPAGAARVRLYRVDEGGAAALATVEAGDAGHTATALENGRSYRFVARSVGPGGVEGPSSAEATAVPEDRLAPAPPRDLIAVAHPQGVLLQWTRNRVDDDVAGYEVEGRPQTGRGDWEVLHGAEPVPGPTFLYARPRATDWMFQVRTVDRTGLRSAPAGPVRAQP